MVNEGSMDHNFITKSDNHRVRGISTKLLRLEDSNVMFNTFTEKKVVDENLSLHDVNLIIWIVREAIGGGIVVYKYAKITFD